MKTKNPQVCKTFLPAMSVKTFDGFLDKIMSIGQVGMTSLQVNCSLTEVNASVFIAVF